MWQSSDDDNMTVYQAIVNVDNRKKSNKSTIKAPDRANRLALKVYAGSDIQILFRLNLSGVNLNTTISSCVVECEVVDVWDKKLAVAESFFVQEKRSPKQHSNNLEERKICSWINNRKRDYKLRIMKCDIRREKWSNFQEKYLVANSSWDKIRAKVEDFIKMRQRKPSKSRKIIRNDINNENKNEIEIKDEILKEKKMFSWIHMQRKKTNYLLEEKDRQKKWDEFCQQYSQFTDIQRKKSWDSTFKESLDFMAKNKRKPSYNSDNFDKDQRDNELLLYRWIQLNNSMYNRNKLELGRRKKWAALLDQYRDLFVEYTSHEDKWNANYLKVVNYTMSHQSKPSKYSLNLEEKKLGKWLYNNNKTQSEEKKKVMTEFNEKYKKYPTTSKYRSPLSGQITLSPDDKKWDIHLSNLITFIKAYERIPYQNEVNEQKVYSWYNINNRFYKENKLDDRRKKAWTEFLVDYEKYVTNKTNTITAATIDEQEIQTKEPPRKKTKIAKTEKKRKQKNMHLSEASSISASSSASATSNTRQQNKSELSVLHQRYKTLSSANLHREFKDNAKLWTNYHRMSEENEESFPADEIPRNLVIAELEKIETGRKKVVVDMGCGMAHIAKHFRAKDDMRFSFFNYDHCSHGQDEIAGIVVHSQDIAEVPLVDARAEIAVLCLAMWGSNCRKYILEAYRLLETGGRLYMVEPTKRWSEKNDANLMIEGQQGGLLRSLLLDAGFQILSERIAKFSFFVCSK